MSSLLSHCAFFLRSCLVLSDHVDAGGTKLYPQSFTIRELKDALQSYTSTGGHTSSVSSASLIEAMVTSLEMQMFFYNATWKSMERATDDDICILLRCDTYEHQLQPARSKLSSAPVPISLVSVTALESASVRIAISTAASPASVIAEDPDTTCLPMGVMSTLTKCYSSTCDESYPCYSSSCPNRKKKTFIVQCYSNGCRNGYGCYSPTCPCRYENDTEIEPREIYADISIGVTNTERRPPSTSDPSIDVIPGQSTPQSIKSVQELPKLSLNTTGSSANNSQVNFFYPHISPATTISTSSFSSSMTPSSPYSPLSPVSPFSPAAWAASSPVNMDMDMHSSAEFGSTRSPISQTLPPLYTQFSNFNSYQDSNLSPHSNFQYAPSPVELSTPTSPNWEPILIISMIGPSVTWVSRERVSLSGTPTTTYDDSSHSMLSSPYSHSIPCTRRPFSSILKSYMEDDENTNTHNATPGNSEVDLVSPTTPYSFTTNPGLVAISPEGY